jgi:hypothetical protein
MSKRNSSEVQDLETSASKRLDEKSSSSSEEEEEEEEEESSIDFGDEAHYEEVHFFAAYLEPDCHLDESGIEHRAYFRWLIERRALFEQLNNHYSKCIDHFRKAPNSFGRYQNQGIQIGYLHVPATKEEYLDNVSAYLPFFGDFIIVEGGSVQPDSFDFGIITGSFETEKVPDIFRARPEEHSSSEIVELQQNELRRLLKMDK